jgi:hypothetical protein
MPAKASIQYAPASRQGDDPQQGPAITGFHLSLAALARPEWTEGKFVMPAKAGIQYAPASRQGDDPQQGAAITGFRLSLAALARPE